MGTLLEKEFQYYLDHQDSLVQKYEGRVLVIKDDEVIGDYNTEVEAVQETCKSHDLGTFLVQKCSPGTKDTTAVFHSRVY